MVEPEDFVEWVVPKEVDSQRLDRFVSERLGEHLSRARAQRLIREGFVLVDGRRTKASHRLAESSTVTVEFPPPLPADLVPEPMELDVIFEDADMIAIAKPAGVPVHPGAGHSTGTLVHGLLAHCEDLSGIGGIERPGIVHRLDKDTSGVMVVAKNDFAHERLAEQFAKRTAKKLYRAWVLGEPEPRGRLDTLIGRHPTHRKRFTTQVQNGKRAVSEFRRVRSGEVSELEVKIETGRTHQVRVHLSDLGHPIVADALYGGDRWSRITSIPLRRSAQLLNRQALHAARLELRHPRDGRLLELTADLPSDLLAFVGVAYS